MTLPLLILMALGLVQLACAQTARLLLLGAAFQAARAGSVWSGDPARMGDAARFALLPTVGATFDADHLGETWERAQRLDAALKMQGSFPDGWVRIETLEPTVADLGVDAQGHPRDELDLEAVPGGPAPPELRVRVRMLYPLHIPFAGDVLFLAWMAERAQATLTYPVVARWERSAGVPSDLADGARPISSDGGLPLVSAEELKALFGLWRAGQPYLPMSATYRVRLQSSVYRRYLTGEVTP